MARILISRVAFVATVVLATASAASAWIPNLADPAEKARFKQLGDIYKQQSKFVDCVVKAGIKCEQTYGTSVGTQECVFATATGPVGSGFGAALAACEAKVDYNKKGTGDAAADYAAMQCPADSDSGTPGNQDYASLTAWQTAALPSTYSQLDTLATLVALLADAAGKDAIATAADTGTLNKYGKGLFTCIRKCEADAKGTKGGGALTDSTTQCDPGNGAADPAMIACYDKSKIKMETQLGAGGGAYAALIGLVDGAIGDGAQPTWNNTEGCNGSPSGAFVDGSPLF